MENNKYINGYLKKIKARLSDNFKVIGTEGRGDDTKVFIMDVTTEDVYERSVRHLVRRKSINSFNRTTISKTEEKRKSNANDEISLKDIIEGSVCKENSNKPKTTNKEVRSIKSTRENSNEENSSIEAKLDDIINRIDALNKRISNITFKTVDPE